MRALERLRAGETLRVGGIQLTDTSVRLSKSKFMGKAEEREYPWTDVVIWSADGRFYVAAKGDRSFQASASYQGDSNTPVLVNLVSSGFERGITRLSDVLQ